MENIDIYNATLQTLQEKFDGKLTLNIDDMATVFDTNKASVYNQLRKKSDTFPIKPRRAGRLLRWNICDVARYLSLGE